MPPQRRPGSRGAVVAYTPARHDDANEHDRVTHVGFARRLASLRDYAFAGAYDASARYPGHVYFVPSVTLLAEEAASLGIRGPGDLFGGVAPRLFVATKAITHPLVAPDAARLPGWNPDFPARVAGAVLAGYTVFNRDDALRAGLRLLAGGPVRIKPVRAAGGRGQSVASDAAQLQQRLDATDPDELNSHGLVLEENLIELRTFSVGQVTVGELTASYFGTQRLTRSNRGQEVFGGADLNFVRGGFDALLAQGAAPEVQLAVAQARRYDAAANACYPGFFASRINYDVALGRDAAGRERSGVLEQSWRIGGATGPELAALEVFRREPERQKVRACAVEIFGESPPPPAGAIVYFRGNDPHAGALTKYTLVEP